ncbi:LacI family transcriptional regulator [Phyllobacterium salinisoli]|uniref:LacI family transcriptional regulator n=1 Tax=Phyllobacterium salinisoli TaxID=1899321 RepID=A0A368K501_9HYPH|nr:LacI family DNA-binding transcriptional regulator [Phyllobacterium salinisoli]RCS24254.1 LacI family transcriptional regulator [Phyllobacterium salinisoli]
MTDRAKIKDIARRAGVSTATVSRALSDSSLVAEATRERIRDAARTLDYRPNVAARNLRMQRSMSVLLVVRDVCNPFYLDIFKGVEAAARAAGYSVLMGNTENDPDRAREYFDMLRDGHADGMILMTGMLPQDYEQILGGSKARPIVVALELIESSDLPNVHIDNRAAAYRAVKHLIDLGHQRIAHISGPMPEFMSSRRREGYLAAMADAGLPVPAAYDLTGDYSLRTGRELCRQLFSYRDRPTALFLANDEMAFGAINELRQLGFTVPDDVSVVGFDDIFLSEAFYPPLTTVSQPREEIGRRAMEMLLALLGGNDAAPSSVELPTCLKVRASTGPVPGR